MKLYFRVTWLLSYLVIVILTIVIINTYGRGKVYEKLYNEKKDNLYSIAETLADEYFTNLDVESEATKTDTDSLRSELKSVYVATKLRIWLVGSRGKIIVDSADGQFEGENLSDYDKTFLLNQFYEGDKLKKLYSDDKIYLVYPISVNQKISGYIVISDSITQLKNKAEDYTDQMIISFMIINLITALVMVFLYFRFQLGLYRVTRIAKEYAMGHFDVDIGKRPYNDFSEIYDSLNYMGKKFGNYSEAQTKFIANVSHDFRSPLTSIKGYTEAMLDGTIEPEMYAKYLEIILFETNRLKKMTDNLLELNNFEHDGVNVELSEFDINEVVRMSAATFENRCKKKKISIELTFSAPKLMVKADLYKIEQVIQNLIDNAIKFSNNNSSIDISVTNQRNKVFVSVKDHGIGIPKESQARIWNRFYKTDLSRGKDKTGSGLGLAIVKEIVEAHGEKINVISTPGVGTEFIFSLTSL